MDKSSKEPVRTLTSTGYFPQICSDYYPLVKIENKETGEIVWQSFQGVWGDNNLLLVICDPDPSYHEFMWHFGTKAQRSDYSNIIINQEGSYLLIVDLKPQLLQQGFIVQ